MVLSDIVTNIQRRIAFSLAPILTYGLGSVSYDQEELEDFARKT